MAGVRDIHRAWIGGALGALAISVACDQEREPTANTTVSVASSVATPLETAPSATNVPIPAPRAPWDGSVADGLPCEERTKRWRERFVHLAGARVVVALPTEASIIEANGGRSPPDWPFLHVSKERVVMGDDVFLESPTTSIDHAVKALSGRGPGVLVAPAVDADIPTLVALLTALDRAKLRVYLIAEKVEAWRYVPSARVDAVAAQVDAAGEHPRVSIAISKAMARAGAGCKATMAGFLARTQTPERADPSARIMEDIASGLSTDGCRCDADAMFELGTWVIAQRRGVVGREIAIARPNDPKAISLEPHSAAELYTSLKDEATRVRFVAPH